MLAFLVNMPPGRTHTSYPAADYLTEGGELKPEWAAAVARVEEKFAGTAVGMEVLGGMME